MTTVYKYLKAVNTKEGEELFRMLWGKGRRSNGINLIQILMKDSGEGKGEKPSWGVEIFFQCLLLKRCWHFPLKNWWSEKQVCTFPSLHHRTLLIKAPGSTRRKRARRGTGPPFKLVQPLALVQHGNTQDIQKTCELFLPLSLSPAFVKTFLQILWSSSLACSPGRTFPSPDTFSDTQAMMSLSDFLQH